jgi:integrase
MALTAKRVSKLIRKGEPGRYLDGFQGKGLYLVVASRTAAHWEKRFQLDGKEHFHGLGSAFAFSLAEARARNRRASQALADGIDPLMQKREAKAQRIAAAARSVTFGECATDFFRTRSPTWRHEKHIAQWRASVLGLTLAGKPTPRDYCRALRSLPVAMIDVPIILGVLRPLWHERPETASRLRGRIEAVLDFAKVSGYRTGDNPATWSTIGKALPSRTKVAAVKHYAAVDYRELPAFAAELRQREGSTARALEFAILTAARTDEVLRMTWGEVDLAEKLWTIPAHRMKAGAEHRVPLSEPALELLRQLPREDDSELTFIGPQVGKPLSEASLRAVMRRAGRIETVHGMRSAFSTWAHETTAYSNHVIEQSLAHAVGSAVERAYRRSDLFDKRRRLMTDWATYCTSPLVVQKAGGKVVPIGGRRS